MITVFRRNLLLVRAIHRLRGLLGENDMGLLGFTNPLQRKLCNAAVTGVRTEFFARVALIHSIRDIYADLVWTASKSHAAVPPDRR